MRTLLGLAFVDTKTTPTIDLAAKRLGKRLKVILDGHDISISGHHVAGCRDIPGKTLIDVGFSIARHEAFPIDLLAKGDSCALLRKK